MRFIIANFFHIIVLLNRKILLYTESKAKDNPCTSVLLKRKNPDNYMNDKIEFKYSEEHGYYVVAKENIEFGETLFIEKPTIGIILWKNMDIRCQNCLLV